ncbi:MAG: 4-hydroxyphenylacetate 3-monooxygenase [Oceanospirillaceae bacterium]|nr:4-hydroxyphenylacetate 3-monooxygenase [Oceanospirillaceae bacterium]
MIKTSAQHIESLRDGRQVYINGELVDDVTTHPAFSKTIEWLSKLYDFQHENQELMTTVDPESGERYNRIWQLPKSPEELKQRRAALEAWTGLSCGFLGRAPDHVASCISGMVMGIDRFKQYDAERAENLLNYYRYARDNDLYLTYVIINPQADRSKSAGEQKDEFLAAGIAAEDDEGLTIRGAKMLATGGIMANEVLVTCLQPLKKGEEEKYAVSFTIPMNAPGLKILSRKSYSEHNDSVFQNPLSSRFDENDALLYFDDVKVPWDRVFVHRDTDMCLAQFHETPAHVYQNYQAQIRLMVKMRFLAGVAYRTAEMNGIINFPPVRETLGQIAAEAAISESFVNGMENKGRYVGEYYVPDRHLLYAAQVVAQQLYPNFITRLRDLAGGGVIMLPSSTEDFANPEMRAMIEKTQQSPVADSEERVKFFNLAWDAIGSEFASRHTQYEMFYSGATFVTKGASFRTFDWKQSTGLLDSFASQYELKDEI